MPYSTINSRFRRNFSPLLEKLYTIASIMNEFKDGCADGSVPDSPAQRSMDIRVHPMVLYDLSAHERQKIGAYCKEHAEEAC